MNRYLPPSLIDSALLLALLIGSPESWGSPAQDADSTTESGELIALEGGGRLALWPSSMEHTTHVVMRIAGAEFAEPRGLRGIAYMLAAALRERKVGPQEGQALPTGESLASWMNAHTAHFQLAAHPEHFELSFSCQPSDTSQVLHTLTRELARTDFTLSLVASLDTKMLRPISTAVEFAIPSEQRILETLLQGKDSAQVRAHAPWDPNRISPQVLSAFHADMFCRARLTLGVVGSASQAELRSMVASALNALPLGSAPALAQDVGPAPAGLQIYLLDQPQAAKTHVKVAARVLPWLDARGGVQYQAGLCQRSRLASIYPPSARRAGYVTSAASVDHDAVARTASLLLDALALTHDGPVLGGPWRNGPWPIPFKDLRLDTRQPPAGLPELASVLMALECELPADHWLLQPQPTKPTTPVGWNKLRERLAAHQRIIMLVSGPVAPMREALGGMGDIHDLDPAEFDLAPTLPQLALDMLAALGGRDAWSRISATRFTVETDMGGGRKFGSEQWHEWQALRCLVDIGAGQTRIGLDRGQFWMRRGNQIQGFDDAALLRQSLARRRHLWDLLRHLAKGELRDVQAVGLNRLRLTVDCYGTQQHLELELNDAHFPLSMHYSEGATRHTTVYEEWAETSGLRYASMMHVERDGVLASRYVVLNAELLDGLPKGLIKPPQ